MKPKTRSGMLAGLMAVSALVLGGCGLLPPPFDAENFLQRENLRIDSEYQDASFETQWSPDGKQVAIRMIAPGYMTPAVNMTTPELPMSAGSDTLMVFDAASGELVNSWSLPTPPTLAQNRTAFFTQQHSQLQWSSDGRNLLILQENRDQTLLQSLTLYKLDISQQHSPYGIDKPAARAIFLPAELKTLETVRFEAPTLSKDGEHLALYRVLNRNGSENYELIELDLGQASSRNLGQLDADPVQGPSWGAGADKLYVMTQSSEKGLPATHFWRYGSDKPELVFALQAKQGIFQLSPDGSRLFATFAKDEADFGGMATVQASPGAADMGEVNLVQNLTTGERTVFQGPITARESDNGGQMVWDSLNHLNFSRESQDDPATRRPALLAFDPASQTSIDGVELAQPLNLLTARLKPQLAAKNKDFPNLDLSFGKLSAISPADNRLLIRLNRADLLSFDTTPMFYLWNPANQQLLSLNTSFTELKCACVTNVNLLNP